MAEQQIKDNEEPKNVGGRPLKFKSVAELESAIDNYFRKCDEHTEMRRVLMGNDTHGKALFEEKEILIRKRPYTIIGLARALGTSRETLLDYESGKYDLKAADVEESETTFSDAIKDAKSRVEQDVEEGLLSGMPATGAIFWLKNNAGWRDRQEIDHTSKDKPIPLLAGLAPGKLVVEDEDGDSPGDDSSKKDQ